MCRLVAVAVVGVLMGAAPASAATGWTLTPSANPSGATQVYLDGVSCTGATTVGCFAVGSYISAQGAVRTLIERWTGTTWKVVPSPNHVGAIANTLVAVSCSSSANCFAVGNWQGGLTAPARTLIERWNGLTWKIAASPNATGATGNFLHGISCIASRCFAVGSYASPGSPGATLIERWNGSTWLVLPSPNARGAVLNTLDGVSCVKAGAALSCFAVGSSAATADGSVSRTLTERWRGSSWLVVASPNFGGVYRSALSAVSCTSAKFCIAVGVWDHAPGASLSERWNGTAWSIVTVKNPVAWTFSQLNSVSCATATSCLAVGSWAKGTTVNLTLVARFNGTGWTIMLSKNPLNSHSSSLSSISCVAAKCSAVGSYLKPAVGLPSAALAERNF